MIVLDEIFSPNSQQAFNARPVNESDKLVEASERLTSIFGCWPSFHDAEVIEFNLWRGDVDADAQRYVFPTLTTKIHLWELTSDLDVRGYYILRHQTLVTLRFHDISELQMQGSTTRMRFLGYRSPLHRSTVFLSACTSSLSQYSGSRPRSIACAWRSSKRSRYPMQSRRRNQATQRTAGRSDV